MSASDPSFIPGVSGAQDAAPAPLQDFGALPSVSPTYANAAQVDGPTYGSSGASASGSVDPSTVSLYNQIMQSGGGGPDWINNPQVDQNGNVLTNIPGVGNVSLAQWQQLQPYAASQQVVEPGGGGTGFAGSPSPNLVQPTQVVAPTAPNANLADPNQNLSYMQQYQSLMDQSLQPQFKQQDQQLQDQLAARGISNSGSAQELTNNLYATQGATVAAANAPIVSQAYANTQQDIQSNQAATNSFLAQGYSYQDAAAMANAQAGNTASAENQSAINSLLAQGYSYEQANAQLNAQMQQQTNLTNAGYANAASGLNAGYYNEALTGNANAYNNYQSTLEQQGYNTGNEELTSYLNSFGPNSGVTSAYNTATGGVQSAANNAFSSANAAQGAALGAGASALAAGGG